MNAKELLEAAKAEPEKQNLEAYREVVEVLREKGFTWRETAEFLSKRGVVTDHSRLFRLFGEPQAARGRSVSREIAVSRVTFIGEKVKRNRRVWNVMEIELPTKLGCQLVVKGFAWSAAPFDYEKGSDDSLTFRNPMLKIRSKYKGLPVACITTEFKTRDGGWALRDLHIVPKWEELL